jgi:hypothetical protein
VIDVTLPVILDPEIHPASLLHSGVVYIYDDFPALEKAWMAFKAIQISKTLSINFIDLARDIVMRFFLENYGITAGITHEKGPQRYTTTHERRILEETMVAQTFLERAVHENVRHTRDSFAPNSGMM